MSMSVCARVLVLVQSTALVFFKRFYTQASCLEHDPLRVMPTCIYLACKASLCCWQLLQISRAHLAGVASCSHYSNGPDTQQQRQPRGL